MKEVKRHIYLLTEKDNDDFLPGYYFADETDGFHGPFSTLEETERILKDYIESLNY